MVSLQGTKQVGLVFSWQSHNKCQRRREPAFAGTGQCEVGARDADGARPRPCPPHARCLQDTAAAGPKPSRAGAVQLKNYIRKMTLPALAET